MHYYYLFCAWLRLCLSRAGQSAHTARFAIVEDDNRRYSKWLPLLFLGGHNVGPINVLLPNGYTVDAVYFNGRWWFDVGEGVQPVQFRYIRGESEADEPQLDLDVWGDVFENE